MAMFIKFEEHDITYASMLNIQIMSFFIISV